MANLKSVLKDNAGLGKDTFQSLTLVGVDQKLQGRGCARNGNQVREFRSFSTTVYK